MSGKFWDRGPIVVTGCTKVSPGCKNCWSEKAHVMRQGRPAWPSDCLTDGKFNGKVHFRLDALREAVKGRKPRVIAIWNDLYHEGVTDEQIADAIGLMRYHTNNIFLIVTKRPKRAALYWGKTQEISPHIWHLVTVENQAMADKRIPDALKIPGKRGLLIEPMLGPICFHRKVWLKNHYQCLYCNEPWFNCEGKPTLEGIHQVICGGETGSGARTMHPDWALSIRDQCQAAGVPFYFKAWGQHLPLSQVSPKEHMRWLPHNKPSETVDGEAFYKVGTGKAGRLLDGREHNDLAWRHVE